MKISYLILVILFLASSFQLFTGAVELGKKPEERSIKVMFDKIRERMKEIYKDFKLAKLYLPSLNYYDSPWISSARFYDNLFSSDQYWVLIRATYVVACKLKFGLADSSYNIYQAHVCSMKFICSEMASLGRCERLNSLPDAGSGVITSDDVLNLLNIPANRTERCRLYDELGFNDPISHIVEWTWRIKNFKENCIDYI